MKSKIINHKGIVVSLKTKSGVVHSITLKEGEDFLSTLDKFLKKSKLDLLFFCDISVLCECKESMACRSVVSCVSALSFIINK